ncbi:MAG TPA: outer membrane protein assembly factor BamD [Terriglobales bacterium]|jgi:outer membrane protein assembly factor BamD|nr:outer membrane protein assembly factor BamD [Terriglobales bacterium]
MSLRTPVIALAAMLALTTACTNKKVNNPLAKVDSKQPDKVLFDRGMDAMKHNRFDVARMTMQTLIATYPDSEFIARAKLALADSWYAEGGTAGMAQAEQEYKDFITFFPNLPEAAEAQLKIANIHFSEMEKPDRDFAHAVRAEQEYRETILQYPDNQKIAAEAKQKLMQVQEVIAEREYRVGRFYYLRESYPAAIARLESLVDRYPLYSKADDALYLIGQSYESQVGLTRSKQIEEREKHLSEAQRKADELARERYINDAVQKASAAYDKILTRYPVMQRADDARARLVALKQPVPRPTKAMLAQNKAEEASRREQTTMGSVMGAFSRHPDVSAAARVGDPSLQTQDLVSARDLLAAQTRVISGQTADNKVMIGKVNVAPAENQKAPTSDNPNPQPSSNTNAAEGSQPDPSELPVASNQNSQPTAPDPNELTVAKDAQPAQAPAAVNEIAQGGTNGGGATASSGSSQGSSQDLATDEQIASSKHKKKKGILDKIIPGK